MLALLKVKLQPSGEYILKEAGQDMTFNQTIGPFADAGEFYKRVARRIAELARAGQHIKYIDLCDDAAPVIPCCQGTGPARSASA